MATKEVELDEEWVKLMIEAKREGLTKEEVLEFLRKRSRVLSVHG